MNDGPNYGHLKQVIEASGAWTRHEYDALGREVKVVRQFLNGAPGAVEAESRVTEYGYAPVAPGDDGTRATHSPRTVVEKLLGQEVGRSYLVVLAFETQNVRCPGAEAAWDAADNLVTITTTYGEGAFKGKTKSVRQPDGTLTLYSYSVGGDGSLTATVATGQPNEDGTAIVDGTRSVSVTDGQGRTLLSEAFDVASGIKLSSTWVPADGLDGFGRITRTNYLDGTFTSTVYGCCGPDRTTDRDGTVTDYIYDKLRRVTATVRLGITSFTDYDGGVASGEPRKIRKTRTGATGLPATGCGRLSCGSCGSQFMLLGPAEIAVQRPAPTFGGNRRWRPAKLATT